MEHDWGAIASVATAHPDLPFSAPGPQSLAKNKLNAAKWILWLRPGFVDREGWRPKLVRVRVKAEPWQAECPAALASLPTGLTRAGNAHVLMLHWVWALVMRKHGRLSMEHLHLILRHLPLPHVLLAQK